MLEKVNLVPQADRHIWSLDSSEVYTVASMRKLLDDHRSSLVSSTTRVKSVPIKVNVFAWKVKMNALLTRFNISRRGIDIESILCPLCDSGAESSNHLFFNCTVARHIFSKIVRWWDVVYKEVNSYAEWLSWLLSLRLTSKLKMMLEGVFYVMWWYLWTFRNKFLFDKKLPVKALIFDEIESSDTPEGQHHLYLSSTRSDPSTAYRPGPVSVPDPSRTPPHIFQPTSVVRNMLGKEQVSQDLGGPASDAALREYCDRNYHQLLPIIAKKVHQKKVQQEKLKAVKARLNFEKASQHSESGTSSRRRDLKKRLGSRHVRSMSGIPEPRRPF
ncbi:RNA-directed DNA polymerase, eukaryota [Tanacetum coccineum]